MIVRYGNYLRIKRYSPLVSLDWISAIGGTLAPRAINTGGLPADASGRIQIVAGVFALKTGAVIRPTTLSHLLHIERRQNDETGDAAHCLSYSDRFRHYSDR